MIKNIIQIFIAILAFLIIDCKIAESQTPQKKEDTKQEAIKENITNNQTNNKDPKANDTNTATTKILEDPKITDIKATTTKIPTNNEQKSEQKPEEKIELIKNSKDKEIKELADKKYDSLMLTEVELKNIKKANEAANNGQPFVAEAEEEVKIKDPKGEQDKLKEKKKKEQEEKLKKEEDEQGNEKSYIYLASIIYFNQKDWVIWINDQKITPKTNQRNKELYIKKVYANQIDVVWKLSITKWKIISGKKSETIAPKINKDNQIEVSFSLKPNQTFMLSNNSVVEGKAVINLIKKKEKQNSINSILNEMKGDKKEDNKEIKKENDFFNSLDIP
jgi:hypothetical protein